MTATTTVKAAADTGRLTLAELRGLLELAQHAGLPDDAVIKARVGWGGHVKTIEAGP